MAYEIAYMKWYCKHNKRLFLTYLLAAAVLLFVLVYLSLLDFKKSETVPLIGPAILVLALNVMMSILTPLYQFRYVMNKRSVDLYYPLPMKKTTMFWLNYVVGMVFICIFRAEMQFLLGCLLCIRCGNAYPDIVSCRCISAFI